MNAKILHVNLQGGQNTEFPLLPQGVILGRAPASDVRLDDPSMSSVHAQVFFQGGAWWVEDRKSLNGTYVNGIRVSGRVQLSHMAHLRCGSVQLWFLLIVGVDSPTLLPGSGPGPGPGMISPRELSSLKQDRDRLREQVEDIRRHAEADLLPVVTERDSLRDELWKIRRTCTAAEQETKGLREDLFRTTQKNGEQELKLQALLLESQNDHRLAEQRRIEVERLKSEGQKKEQAADEKRLALEGRVRDLEAKGTLLLAENSELRGAVKQSRQKADEQEVANQNQKQEKEKATQALDQRNREMRELRGHLTELEVKVSAAEKKAELSTGKLDAIIGERDTLKKRYDERVVAHTGVNAENRLLRDELLRLKDVTAREVGHLRRENRRLTEALEERRDATPAKTAGTGQAPEEAATSATRQIAALVYRGASKTLAALQVDLLTALDGCAAQKGPQSTDQEALRVSLQKMLGLTEEATTCIGSLQHVIDREAP